MTTELTSVKDAQFIKIVTGNRSFTTKSSSGRIKQMAKDILEGRAEFMPPITVTNGTFYLLDGQHRLEAFKIAWEQGSKQPLRVRYVDCPEDKMIEVIIAMQKGKDWTNYDYFESFVKQGNESAVKLKQFAEKHPEFLMRKDGRVSLHITAAMLYGDGRKFDSMLRKNIFLPITEQEFKRAEKLCSEVSALAKRFGWNRGNWTESMVGAWHQCRNDEKLSTMVNCVGFKDFVNSLQVKHFVPLTKKTQWFDNFDLSIRRAYDRLVS